MGIQDFKNMNDILAMECQHIQATNRNMNYTVVQSTDFKGLETMEYHNGVITEALYSIGQS